MQAAGHEVKECLRVLESVDLNLVGEVLRGHGTFYEMEHYPPDDVHDKASHSQYYYHAHRNPGADADGEHGHFHAFLRGPGMPAGTAPVPYSGNEVWPSGEHAIAHLVALSMDAWGRPVGLFTTNRWVTAETFHPAQQVIGMLDRFAIDHANPSWPVNRWITAMLVLFRPQISALLHERDAVIAAWASQHVGEDVFEDRALEITSQLAIDIDAQIESIDCVLAVRARPRLATA